MDRIFQGKRALIVGGTGGIGGAMAKRLGELGASVVVHGGSSRERLDRTVADLKAAGVDAAGFLLKIDSPRAAVEIFSRHPDADILVCAWGPFARAPLAKTSAEDWERAALLDLAFPGALASAYVGPMAARGFGRLVFFGGTATDSIRGFTTTAAYSAAKTGIGVLVKSIALEYAGSGVSAVALCPGFVDTEYLSDAVRADLRSGAPGGRLLQTSEIAEIALNLSSSEAANGALIPLDGGLDLGRRRIKTI